MMRNYTMSAETRPGLSISKYLNDFWNPKFYWTNIEGINTSNSILQLKTANLSDSMVTKIHNANISFRPIISACGTSTNNFDKFLTEIFNVTVTMIPHSPKTAKDKSNH